MSFFRKAFRTVGHAFSKGASEVASTFRKGGNVIARGLGGMAGGSLGAEIGGGIASVFGPEAVPVGAAIGGLIGRQVGSEGAGRIETTTRGIASGKRPVFGQQIHNVQRAHEMQGALPIPDGKFFHAKFPEKKEKKAMVGVGGAGQRQMMTPEQKRNELEKMRTQQKERQQFV